MLVREKRLHESQQARTIQILAQLPCQDRTRFLFHRYPRLGRANAQALLHAVVKLANGQAGHAADVAVDCIDCNDCTTGSSAQPSASATSAIRSSTSSMPTEKR